MRVYIAGPMTGLPDHNFPLFNKVAEDWRQEGHMVFNPAENFLGRKDLTREQYARADIPQLLQSDAVVLLNGWERSWGARIEVLIALELNLKFRTPDFRFINPGDIRDTFDHEPGVALACRTYE